MLGLSDMYVFAEDVISAVPVNEVVRLLSHCNSVRPSVQFTFERQNDTHLPFLDFNVHRTDRGNLETSIYIKPTHNDIYFTFDFYHICHSLKSCEQGLRLCLIYSW